MSSPIISVFGSSRVEDASEPYQTARQLGEALARAGFAVATGGYGGVMEAVSRGAAEAGGRVIGVVTSRHPVANAWVQETVVVPDWEQRLWKLMALGEGYVACPGGTGTLVELAVAWEMRNKGRDSRKPIVALGDFWRPVVERVESAEENCRGLVRIVGSIPEVVEMLLGSRRSQDSAQRANANERPRN